MTRTKKIITSLIAVMMVFSMLFAMAVPVSAATRSSGKQTRTITVTTKANYWYPGSESITLSQTKGVCTNYRGKTSKQYGDWDITVRATDGSHTFTKNFNGSSIKLNLKPNKTYQITVSWDSQGNYITQLGKGNFTTLPTWRVKSTWKVSSYY